MITCPPDRGGEYINSAQAEMIILLGVDLRIRSKPPLHSKVYQFEFPEGDRASFIGSANFTTGGFERNDETVAFFKSSVDNQKVEWELDRLSRHGALSYMQWKESAPTALHERMLK